MKKYYSIENALILLIVLFPFTILILLSFGIINSHFSDDTMHTFSRISEISLYCLSIVLFINFVLSKKKGKYKALFEKLTLSSVYLLLGLTIISVNVPIYIWSIAVSLTVILMLYSIIDIFPRNK